MNFSKLTLASFLTQAVFFNLAGTNKALCTATVLEQEEEDALQGGDFSDKNSNLRGNKLRSSYHNRILSSDGDENRFLVKFKDHDHFVAADMKLQSDPHQIMSLPDDDVEVMTFESEEELQYWEQREDVEYVEPDHKIYPLAEQTPYGINLVKALGVSDASVSNQKVCIIDTGYDINHPDLQSSTSIITGHSQVSTSWTKDGNGHGTHVAGTIAAIGGNNQGVVGVNRNGKLKLHIVKVFDDSGSWTRTSDLIRAVENCAAAGATVVNMSLGSSAYSRAEDDAMTRIYNQGVLLVAAAGNNGSSSKSYPASYPSVMSVAGVDSSNKKYSGSQYNDEVDIAAPGVDVWSTFPGGRYAKLTGTSMASPHVAGVAALVWSHFPAKTAKEIRQALESTAQDLGSSGRDDIFGHGLVRADLAYNSLKGYEYITIYGGRWGEWKPWAKSQGGGMYACGAMLRSEDHQGAGDDTGANGLKLKYCDLDDWSVQQEQTIWNGNWGAWKGWAMCPYGKYIGGANVRFEDHQGWGDDTGLNGLAIYCVDKNWSNGEVKIVYNGKWGGWKGWSYREGTLVKGARVRYEDHQGAGDDTAMNGIQFHIEKPSSS